MIFDRTENDILNAKNALSKLKSFQELTEEDLLALERGTITADTLNRIEFKEKELFDLFVENGYYAPPIITKEWSVGLTIFDELDFQRIIENGEILREAFFVYFNAPQKAKAKYDFSNINNIEKLLYDLQSMLEYMVANIKECDTFECGEE